MRSSSAALAGAQARAAAGLLYLHVPMFFILLYAFTTEDKSYQFPPPGLTLHWFAVAWERQDIWNAIWLSVRVALARPRWRGARHACRGGARTAARFFGREAITLLIILPIALPGIVTGIALRAAIDLADLPFSFWTIVVGHATFCVVVVYNNALARLRRTSGSLIEASMDLGADGFQTFRYVILPNLATALLAGGMLAFALSLRRGDRHHLHRRPADHAADLDADRAGAPAPAAGHQRRRGVRDRRDLRADPARLLPDARHRDGGRQRPVVNEARTWWRKNGCSG